MPKKIQKKRAVRQTVPTASKVIEKIPGQSTIVGMSVANKPSIGKTTLASNTATQESYVKNDIKWSLIVAAIVVAVMVVLYFVFR